MYVEYCICCGFAVACSVFVCVSKALPVEVPIFIMLLLKTDDSQRLVHFFPQCIWLCVYGHLCNAVVACYYLCLTVSKFYMLCLLSKGYFS